MFDPWVGKIPWRKAWQPTPVFWPGEFHGVTKSRTRLSDFHFHLIEDGGTLTPASAVSLLSQDV